MEDGRPRVKHMLFWWDNCMEDGRSRVKHKLICQGIVSRMVDVE